MGRRLVLSAIIVSVALAILVADQIEVGNRRLRTAPATVAASQCGVTMTCWFVRPNGGAYGAEDGTDWDNAFDGFSDIAWASVACGDTIWVAGGTYTQELVPSKTCTAGNVLAVRRARADASAATSAAGWSAAFDATVTQTAFGVTLGNIAYITVSGFTTGSTCGRYQGSCGWVMDFTGTTAGSGIECPNGTSPDFVTVEYLEFLGAGEDVNFTNDARAVDCTPITTLASNMVFSRLKLHDSAEAFVLVPCQTCTIEFSEIYAIDDADPNAPNSCCHPNMVYIDQSEGGASTDLTFTGNILHGRQGEGVFYTNSAQDATNATITRNLWFGVTEGKCIQMDNTGAVTNAKINNNTFDGGCPLGIFAGDGPSSYTGEARNNLIRATGSPSPFTALTVSNQVSTTDTGVFVDQAGSDFHIVATVGAGFPRDAGIDLSAQYTTDLDGVTFGADGTWDIGAYEYVP